VTKQEVYAGLTEIVQDLLGDDSIVLTAATTAKDVDGWDSFNHLNIIAAAESRFAIKFNMRDIEKLTNVGTIVDMILLKAGS
jgi:acyl carrier protein